MVGGVKALIEQYRKRFIHLVVSKVQGSIFKFAKPNMFRFSGKSGIYESGPLTTRENCQNVLQQWSFKRS